MLIKAVILDWDGVLYDSTEIYLGHHNRILQEYGIPTVALADFRERISTWSAVEHFRRAGVADAMGARERFLQLTRQEPRPQLYPDAKATLGWLDRAGIAPYVVSTHPREDIIELLRQFRVDSHIRSVHESTTIQQKVTSIPAVVRELEILPREVVYVDDMDEVLKEAKTAGCYIVGAAYGNCSYARLAKVGPHGIISSLFELRNFIASLE